MSDSQLHLASALRRCEGYCDLKMWEAAWEELEALPSELKQDLAVLTWRMQIQMGMGEHQKASFIGLSLVQQFPKKLGIPCFRRTALLLISPQVSPINGEKTRPSSKMPM